MKKVILSQAKIAYLRKKKKNKPKLLMLHGLFTHSCYFSETVEYLKDDFDILIPEFPGFGHFVFAEGRCPQDIVAEFLDNPELQIENRCPELYQFNLITY